jgi:hypothetical protein
MTFHILGIVTPTDELMFFRGVGIHQPVMENPMNIPVFTLVKNV